MLQIRNLTISHRKDLKLIIEDFSFVLNSGDKAVIIGEEGNGKSTLLKLIYDPELVGEYTEYSGEIIKNGQKFGYLAQEMTEGQKELTVLEFLAESPQYYYLQPNELSGIGKLIGLELDFFYSDQRVGSLSGGEKVKCQLARILMDSPDVLLLDEPSNDIDIETLEWLEKFIRDSKKPVLFVSHDETLIENTANIIIHIEQIRHKTVSRHTIAKMGYKQYITERLHGFERQEQIAKKEQNDYNKKMEKYRQIEQRVEHEQNVITRQNPAGGRLLKKKMHAVKSMGRRLEKGAEDFTQMPESEEAILVRFDEDSGIPNGKVVLDFSLDCLKIGERILAKDIHLMVKGPKKLGIIGKNGAGKTTLIRKIAEDLLARQDIKAAYMPQNYMELLDEALSPVEYLTITGDKEEHSRIRTYLGSMKYTAEEMSHTISELSGGQKAKLLFLKMSMEKNNVLILDEPTRNFSPLSNPVIRNILSDFRGSIISVSHDRKYLGEVCDVIYVLKEDGLVRKDVRE